MCLAYALFNTSATVAKMVNKGLLAHIGAHGEPPLGLNYHAEMSFTQQGGLSNYQVHAFRPLSCYPRCLTFFTTDPASSDLVRRNHSRALRFNRVSLPRKVQ